ncbi:MAG: epoxyqueuosine reductase [Desulfobacula sp.]|nr:epoxyqueuosine reductase [Desulfobacula sp.]
MNKYTLSENIRNFEGCAGIDAIGIANASQFANYSLKQHKRRDPKLTMPSAKSIIVVGTYIGSVTMPEWKDPWYGRTSRLYLSGFFLDVVKPLEPIAHYLIKKGYQARICDGSIEGESIVPLKLAAIRAGLGWQGKHSLLISKKYGTFLALGGILTNAGLEHNVKEESNQCHKCTECQKVCPVDAIKKSHVLDINKCLSSLLSKDDLPRKAAASIENRIQDCEICQEACPWNKKHIKNPLTTKMTTHFQGQINRWKDKFFLQDLSELSKQQYEILFENFNIDIPFHIFQRNVKAAIKQAQKITQEFQHS